MICYVFPSSSPACSAKVSPNLSPLLHHEYPSHIMRHSHAIKQDTLPIASLISKQVVPYRTHGDTCSPEVSTL
jgi:hypothetical protein